MTDLNTLSRDELSRLSELLYEYLSIVTYLDIGDDNPAYFENMAQIRSRCDEIVAALSKPFTDIRQYVVEEVGRVMTEKGNDKVKTEAGTFYFTSPTPAVYVKNVKDFMDKLEAHPEVRTLLEGNLTFSAKTGSLVFRSK